MFENNTIDAEQTTNVTHIEQAIRASKPQEQQSGVWYRQEPEIKKHILQALWNKILKYAEDGDTKERFRGYIEHIKENPLCRDGEYNKEIENLLDKAFTIPIKLEFDEFFDTLKSISLTFAYFISDAEKLDLAKSQKIEILNPKIKEEDGRNIAEYLRDKKISATLCVGNVTEDDDLTTIASKENKGSDVFCMLSVGKILTGVLIFKLINEGILKKSDLEKIVELNEEVTKKLPLAVQERLKHVTLLQLMTHTSGIGNYARKYHEDIVKRVDRNEPQIESLSELLPFVEEETFPIDKYHYSNAGMLLVGFAIEHAYNSKYKDEPLDFNAILQKYIIDVVGMPSFSTKMPKGVDLKYTPKPNPEDKYIGPNLIGSPAGAGSWINVEDLAKFARWMYKEYHHTNPESNQSIIKFEDFLGEYGKEFYNKEDNAITHGGGLDSACSDFIMSLKTGATFIMLSNQPRTTRGMKDMIMNNVFRAINQEILQEAPSMGQK